VSDGFCGMAMGRLRFIFGLEHQGYPSVLTGLEMETEAIWNHLNLINLNGHVTPPLKNTPITEVDWVPMNGACCRYRDGALFAEPLSKRNPARLVSIPVGVVLMPQLDFLGPILAHPTGIRR
jgi:hypothetical protein